MDELKNISSEGKREIMKFKNHYLPCQNVYCGRIMTGIVSYETTTKRKTCWECQQLEKQCMHDEDFREVMNSA